MQDLLVIFIPFLLGVIATVLVTINYYEQAARPLKDEASELRRLNELILIGMENSGLIRLRRDGRGKVQDFLFPTARKTSGSPASDTVELR